MREHTLTVSVRIRILRTLVPIFAVWLPGCAHNTYTASSLPRQFAAHSIPDYSMLNLTAYSKHAPDDSQIRPGDRLQIHVNSGIGGEQAIEKWTVSVGESGEAELPNVGSVRLAGLTNMEAEQSIVRTSIARDVYLTPAVYVSLQDRREMTIAVSGAVESPGHLKLAESSLSVADLIVRAGGLTSAASGLITISGSSHFLEGDNQLRSVSHPESQASTAMTIDLATTSPEVLADIQVPAGAIVSVEERPVRPIQVIGVIRDRAIELPPGRSIRLLDALTLAGGPTYSNWISDRVTVIRQARESNQTIRIRASIRRAKKSEQENLVLAPMDIVSVEENVVTFTLSTLGGLTGLTNAARYATVP